MAKAPKSSQAPDTSLVKALADILDDAGLAELEYETEAVSVRLSRVSGAAAVAPVTAMAAPAAVPAATPVVAADPAPAASADHPGAVKSPMVGTIYTAPEPGSPNFVDVGSSVKKGQTLFIVEAMKVMNPITAPADGTVKNILVQNAQPIEFDEVLIVIE